MKGSKFVRILGFTIIGMPDRHSAQRYRNRYLIRNSSGSEVQNNVFSCDKIQFPSSMSRAKNQHTVPQTYLRNFSSDGENLWVYDKVKKQSFRNNIDSIATGRYFYDDPEIDQTYGDQALENFFSRLEGGYQPVFNRLNTNGWILDDETKGYLAEFVSFQLARTRTMRSQLENFPAIMEAELRKKGADDALLERYGIIGDLPSAQEAHTGFLVNPDLIQDMVTELKSRIWFISDNQSQHDYLCSDHPVVQYVHRDIAHGAIEHFMPLSPDKGLHIFIGEYFPDWAKLENRVLPLESKEAIKFYNSLQVTQSYRQVYNHSNYFKMVTKIMDKSPNLSDINAPKIGIFKPPNP